MYSFVELVDPDQFLAAGAVLAFIYMHRIPPSSDCTVKSLLDMIHVSDRWMVPSCVQACHKALACIDLPSLSSEDAVAIYHLPTCLLNAEGLAPALDLAEARLLSLLGDTVEVVDSPLHLLQQWLELPYAAVLALLSSDDLTTDNEDTVIMLLSWWLEEKEGRKCTGAEELKELQTAVRYSRLSRMYLTQLVPKLPRLCISEKHLLALLEVQAWEEKSDSEFPVQMLQQLSLPAGWLKPARQSTASNQKVVLTLEISEARLRWRSRIAADRGTRGPIATDVATTTINVRGLRVTLRLGFDKANEMMCSLDIQAQLPKWDKLTNIWPGVPGEVKLRLIESNHEQQWHVWQKGLVLGQAVWSVNELAPWNDGNPFDMLWWAPFLIGGVAKLTATISLEPSAFYHFA